MTWHDLTQPFHEEIPGSPALPAPEVETLRRVEDDGMNVQRYSAPTHVGTHVDAPRHFVPDGPTIDEYPLDRFAGPGVVLDLERSTAEEIPLSAVQAAADDAGGVRPGDIVFIRTGWGRRFDEPETYQRYPWLAGEVADWLLDRGVNLLGVDTVSPDRPRTMRPDDWAAYPNHRTLLPADVLIVEHLFLEAVAGDRLEIVAFPLKLRGGDGAPVRVGARKRRADSSSRPD
ncbi:cyclase family protein [Natronomonas amylolytica]|uniref:cyclase family protein n=1 Tax=Natronomonas amylolytica TaxID=3108498 RepID=UPI00300B61AA